MGKSIIEEFESIINSSASTETTENGDPGTERDTGRRRITVLENKFSDIRLYKRINKVNKV